MRFRSTEAFKIKGTVHEKHERHEMLDGGILYREECYQIQGAVFEVYREMGCGFLEAVYQECLGKEFSKRGIPFVAHQEQRLLYKGEPLLQTYIPDFICHESIIIELKALAATTGEHKA
ncbi:MAG: GxxExxY protein, partial [Gallionella sp.]